MIRIPIISSGTKLLVLALLFTLAAGVPQTLAQSNPITDQTKLMSMSDSELMEFWQQAQKQGYTIEQIKAMALARGLTDQQIGLLEQRLRGLVGENSSGNTSPVNPLAIVDEPPAYLDGFNAPVGTVKDSLFGFSFFMNSTISFSPNLNLATPETYVLGPGDELAIGVWGAAENTYYVPVDREGAVRIPNLGPIYVSGVTISDATKKIKSSLRRIYAGIGAPSSSPYFVGVDVAIVKVRTVQVNIIGEVKVPGTYSLSALSTVLNGLYASGGPTREGTFRNIQLIRSGKPLATFDVYGYLLNGSEEGNLNLRDGDIILVAPYESQVTVQGPVKRSGIFELRSGETFADLFRFTSGFKSTAYKDMVLVNRIEDDRRKVVEVTKATFTSEQPKDGDLIRVKEVIDKFENAVSISGAVYRPGIYPYSKDLQLSDLIEKASGLNDQAFLDRAIIISSEDGIEKSSRSFSLREIISGAQDIALQPYDEIYIYNKYDLQEQSMLTIEGAVNNPISIPFIENLSLEDFILMADGFSPSANPKIVDVFRRIKDDSFETLAESISVSTEGDLLLSGDSNFILEPNDRVSVRYLRGYNDQKRVEINGEINLAGTYLLTEKNQRISDLIDRAGGISDYAYVAGASLVRKNPYYKADIQNTVINNLNDSTAVATDSNLNNQESFKVGIDLSRILQEGGRGSKYDLILEDGYVLIIPSTKETIKIEGEVLVPSMVRFDDNYTVLDYINKSGGFSNNAKKGKTYVIYANGDIASTKNFLFFRSYPKIRPGAVILVPTRPQRSSLSVQEGVGITTGLVSLALLIQNLTR